MTTPTPLVPPPAGAGAAIVRLDLAGTAAFVVAGGIAAVTDAGRAAMITVSMALFALGIAAFIWSFFVAAERSRAEEIGVANLYLLTGPTASTAVKRTMALALAVQVVACLAFGAVGFAGLGDDEVNPMAFGILVPMFGLGLNGLWASRHGAFGPRIVTAAAAPRRAVPPQDPDLEKNARHG